MQVKVGSKIIEFLSTPSARRATITAPEGVNPWDAISIHALREEGDAIVNNQLTNVKHFYPRPPRGGRPVGYLADLFPAGFLSTPSARRATRTFAPRFAAFLISIHALREEGDSTSRGMTTPWTHFYPRPPRGGRRAGCQIPAP